VDGEVLAATGLPVDEALLAALPLDGSPVVLCSGPVQLADVACDALPGARLVVGRCAERPFDEDERALLTAMSMVLALALRARLLVDDERSCRGRSDAEAEDKAGLLATVQERQTLLERLARIQRSINARQPLNEILDAIVIGATELLARTSPDCGCSTPTTPTS
jgi:hypothetical protein